jgi:DNA (cytosine-5)-methyltransferase 1
VSFCELGQERLRSARKTEPTVVDLFAGAGGMGLGFRDAGFRVALAIENDRDAAQTYRLNHPGVPVLEVDMRRVEAEDVLAIVGARPDVVCAGPPCQSFSMAGRRANRDPRHRLYRHVLEVADALKPRVVLIENVPGVSRVMGRRSYIHTIKDELEAHYASEVRLLDASAYGVPQLRNRYFFFGRRRRTAEIGTPPTTHSLTRKAGHRLTPTVTKALATLPRRLHGSRNDVHKIRGKVAIRNLATMLHSKRVVMRIKRIHAGEGPLSYRRIPRDYAQTIVAGHRALPVHPTAHRTISVREAARLQGFPDDYAFLGPRANQPLQVANAVPPPLARAIAQHIRVHLERYARRK